ncbi:MAG: hypothetical protein ACP5GW_04060, partial [Caldisericaceae bacterium]
PLIAYQIESHDLFDGMLERVKDDTVRTLFRVVINKEEKPKEEIEKENTSISKDDRKKRRVEEKKLKKKRKL